MIEAGFFAPNHHGKTETRNDLGTERFGLDDFSRETGVEESDLKRFFKDTEQQLQSDPQLLEQLNEIRKSLGLPPIKNAKQAGLQNFEDLKGEDLAALLVMWALQQQAKQNGGSGSGRDLGRMTSNPSSIARSSPQSWGGGSGGGGGNVGGGGGGGGAGATPAGRPANVDMSKPASFDNLPKGDKSVGTFLEKALAQNGDNYVWGAGRSGGADPDSFDCSGLVIWASQQAGVNAPGATAEQMAANAPRISTEEALRTPGALLFRDGHVGISLGNGEVLHAKGSQYGVVREKTNAGEWSGGGLISGMNYGGSVGTP
jgi:hypothetical protein